MESLISQGCTVTTVLPMVSNYSTGLRVVVMWQEMQKCERKDGVEDRKLVNMDVNNAGFKIVFKNLIF